MDKLRQMQIFAAVAGVGGFAAASRRLNMSPPAVTRGVAQLEDHLGVQLFYRTTRDVRLTDSGASYLADVRRILDEVESAEAGVRGDLVSPTGKVTITAPVLFGQYFVTPSLVRFLEDWPDIDVEAVFLDRIVNMLEEGIDLAVRIGHLPDSSLKAVRVGSVRTVLCASPDYLERRGTPANPAGLAGHCLIRAMPLDAVNEWRFQVEGKARRFRIAPRISVTSNSAAIAAAEQGFGITRLISYQMAPSLNAGKLVTVLEDFELPDMPVHILHRESQVGSAKVRLLVDRLRDDLRNEPALRSAT